MIYHELSFIEQVSSLMYTDTLWLYYHFSKLQNYKLQITLRSWGVCLPAAKEQKFIIIYNIYIIYNNKNIYIINYYLFIIKLSFFTYSAQYEKSDGP